MVEMKLNKLLDYTCLSISLASVPPVALASAPDIIILPGNLRAVNIAAGYSHFVILAEDGSIHIYGQKFPSSSRSLIASGQEHYKLPIRWGHIEGIACGALHTIVLTSLGQVLCFGDNQKGQLGVGDSTCMLARMPLGRL
jgi:alpha-tubulin suppressor-like RCC1 family protein